VIRFRCIERTAGLSFRNTMSPTEPQTTWRDARQQSSANSPTGVVFDVKRFALHDGPGIRTTVFLKGCPLSCSWCHNPESQSPKAELMFSQEQCIGCGTCIPRCPVEAITMFHEVARTNRDLCTACGECVGACSAGARAIAGAAWSVDSLLEEIEKDLLFYDESGGGVTLSGGEPLAQSAFAISLLEACRERRIHTTVDTCGYAEWKVMESVARLTDLFLYDVKHVDDDRHRELTGVSNRKILENLRRLDGGGSALWIRYPVIPEANDAHADTAALGEFVGGLKSVEAIHLLPFHRGGETKLERLGRTSRLKLTERDPRSAADTVAETLREMLTVPVYVGG